MTTPSALRRIRLVFASTVCLFAALPAIAATAPQARITAPIENSSRATLTGTLSPRAIASNDAGAVPGNTKLTGITLVFSRTADQQAALDALIAAQQNPASPQYHQWLTPQQFGAQFGAADSDIAAVESWLQQQGFSINGVSNSRDRIKFSGTAGQVKSAFDVELHNFRSGTETHFAPATEISVPSAIASSVATVTNLSSFRPRSHLLKSSLAQPKLTSSQTQSHFLTPLDIATIYDINPAYSAGYTGANQSIAIIGQSAVVPADITNFQTALGLPAKAPILDLVPNTGTATPFQGDEAESDLDLEYSSSIAKGASVYFVYTGSSTNAGVLPDSLQYAVDQNLAPIISSSYGECEPLLGSAEYTSLNAILAQAAAQGQTVISAAGDDGSTDCFGEDNVVADEEQLAVDFPASSQYVTGLGGTEFPSADVAIGNNTYFSAATTSDVISSALSYIPEQVWNDDAADAPGGAADLLDSGGGGTSIFTPRPTWQTGVTGIPSGSFRLVPDISLDSSNSNAPYTFCTSDTTAWNTGQVSSCTSGLRDASSQDFTIAGGTSFAAPIFAGMLAIINQSRASTGQGVINSTLYSLAANATTYASAFHDTTVGGNQCLAGTAFCSTTGAASYLSTTDYDEASGLGSVDLYNLLNAWPGAVVSPNASFSLAATNVTVTPGTNGTSTITVTPAGGFTGAVSFTVVASNSLTFACYSLPNATITGTAAVSSTLTIVTNASSCASGTSTLDKSGASSGGIAANHTQPPTKYPGKPLTAVVAAAFLACFSLKRRTRKSLASISSLCLSLTLLAVLGLSGCSNNSASGNTVTSTTPSSSTSTTPANTYSLTVQATSTSNTNLIATTTFTLTVN